MAFLPPFCELYFTPSFGVSAAELPTSYAWLGIICYALQIYFDFSAYSDMVIGLGWIFGFHFNENFNDPYISLSIQEFWRRWHISLSTWFRDYVYIPLGGNRKGMAKTYRNLIIVFFLTGLWHGANWTFICWGLYHGAFSLLERKGGSFMKKLPKPVCWIYTMLVVLIGWVLFRADSLADAFSYIKVMFTINPVTKYLPEFVSVLNLSSYVCLALAIAACVPVFLNAVKKMDEKMPVLSAVLCLVLFVVSLSYLMGEPFNPFIYFKF